MLLALLVLAALAVRDVRARAMSDASIKAIDILVDDIYRCVASHSFLAPLPSLPSPIHSTLRATPTSQNTTSLSPRTHAQLWQSAVTSHAELELAQRQGGLQHVLAELIKRARHQVR